MNKKTHIVKKKHRKNKNRIKSLKIQSIEVGKSKKTTPKMSVAKKPKKTTSKASTKKPVIKKTSKPKTVVKLMQNQRLRQKQKQQKQRRLLLPIKQSE